MPGFNVIKCELNHILSNQSPNTFLIPWHVSTRIAHNKIINNKNLNDQAV